MRAARWRIEGRVQGVGFRDWMVREARAHGVAGWVRNTRGGDVEALVQGSDEALASLHQACLRGPPAARVTRIEATDPGPTSGIGERPEPAVPAGFHRRPSA